MKMVTGIGEGVSDRFLVIVFNIKKSSETIDKTQKMCYNISIR